MNRVHISGGAARDTAQRALNITHSRLGETMRNTDSHLPFVWGINLRPPMFFGKSCLLSTEAQTDARGKRRVLAVNTNTCTLAGAPLRPISFSGKGLCPKQKHFLAVCSKSLFLNGNPCPRKISRAGRYVCFSAWLLVPGLDDEEAGECRGMSDLKKVLMSSRVCLGNKTKHEYRREAHNRSEGVPMLLYVYT